MELFESAYIGTMRLKNRFVRSATWDGMADEQGNPTEPMLALYRELAAGGVALLKTGVAYVDGNSLTFPRQLGLYDDSQVPAFSKLTAAVHEAGSLLGIQLGHGGSLRFIDIGKRPVGPSPVEQPVNGQAPDELSTDEIGKIVAAFASAAARAKMAGFDCVEMNFGHGYLVSQFFSPHFNKRSDEYGGSRENRGRLALEIVDAVRKAVGPDYPVLVKTNCADFTEGGLEEEDALYFCKEMAKHSVDALELSGGTLAGGDLGPARPDINSRDKEAYFKSSAATLKPDLGCKLVLVGGIRSLETAEELLAGGNADFFSLCRPLISEPDLIGRWAAGNPAKARCISCNECVGTALGEANLYCKKFTKK